MHENAALTLSRSKQQPNHNNTVAQHAKPTRPHLAYAKANTPNFTDSTSLRRRRWLHDVIFAPVSEEAGRFLHLFVDFLHSLSPKQDVTVSP